MGTQHIIELNGKKYDALTGKMLPPSELSKAKDSPSHAAHHSMDGIVGKKPHGPRKVTGTHIPHHEVHKSKTLMRRAVKKPAAIVATHSRSTNQSQVSYSSSSAQLAPSIKPSSPARLDRAVQTKRSALINRFGGDIVVAPKHPSKKQHAIKAAHLAVASVSAPITNDTTGAESLMANAFAHNEPKIKKKPVHHRVAHKLRLRPKTLNITAAVLAFMILGSFFAYSNVPNLTMQVAARRSKVNASLPDYKPAGFALYGPIKYQPGEIIVGYKSNSDERRYDIKVRSSAWDTESLRENFVSGLNTAYQTVQNKGKTVYLYGESSATWVDGGVWYTIEGESQLNTEQVLRIVGSL